MSHTRHAILFDLDGTLLENNVALFFPEYFKRLGQWMAHLLPPQAFHAHLQRAIDAMLANDGQATNEDVFTAAFYPPTGYTRDELEPVFMDFYSNEFPQLRQHTTCKPAARQVVAQAFMLGFEVVIATNPLFPLSATRQRMEWAGVADFPFRLVTTYENSRACKPNLRYFEHILAHLGQPPEACVMVGDESWDMVAGHLGCTTFLVPGVNTQLDNGVAIPEPHYRGALDELCALLPRWREGS